MICPKCSSEGSYYKEWDEFWDGENEEVYLNRWWDCFSCNHRVLSYDAEWEDEE